jgi:hypothetical protein
MLYKGWNWKVVYLWGLYYSLEILLSEVIDIYLSSFSTILFNR